MTAVQWQKRPWNNDLRRAAAAGKTKKIQFWTMLKLRLDKKEKTNTIHQFNDESAAGKKETNASDSDSTMITS